GRMSRAIKSISDPKLKLEILSAEDVKKIHAATLWIIEKVGVRFPSERALDIWEAHGAAVDRGRGIVKARGELIESALKTCPPAYPLAARDPEQDLFLDGNHVYLGTDGCGVEVLDINTGLRRTSRLQDVRDIARIADATEEVAFHWVPVSAQDTPVETRGLHEITRLSVALGGKLETMAGLAGMGDLVLTCTGSLSRNRTVGVALGKGKKLPEILGEMRAVAEGVKTSRSAKELSLRHGIEMPIATEMYQVLYENLSPREAIQRLMSRSLKAESAR
ncbi:MAG: trimethylamine methyltransferase family protein, partial [Thermoanaerobaculia bacterium]